MFILNFLEKDKREIVMFGKKIIEFYDLLLMVYLFVECLIMSENCFYFLKFVDEY